MLVHYSTTTVICQSSLKLLSGVLRVKGGGIADTVCGDREGSESYGKGHNSDVVAHTMRSEALRQTNLTMKERFEDLTAWRGKQQEERDFLENKLAEARSRIEALMIQNQELSRGLGKDGKTGGLMVRVD